MNHKEIRKKYFEFIKSRGFEVIPSASLVPENDPSVLFTTAGVQPLVPYLMGEKHPLGNKVANLQKCTRTVDLEAIGDDTHLSFFEMIGYWYLGNQEGSVPLKQMGVNNTYEMFFGENGFQLDIDKAYFTCFEGNEFEVKDDETAGYWKNLGISDGRIFYTVDSNWWETGENGPCGPDTEIFYNISGEELNIKSKDDFIKADEEGKIVEIGNTVFMLFEKKNGKIVGNLPQQNVDFGGGFERLAMVVQNKKSVYETDLFESVLKKVNNKIITDHLRTSVMMISDGVIPSNTDQGYVLRRLVRRVVRFSKELNLSKEDLLKASEEYLKIYEGVYKICSKEKLVDVLGNEIDKFEKTLEKGLKEFEKMTRNGNLSGHDAFLLFTTHGFPFEITKELADEKGIKINSEEFYNELNKHRELSKTASAGKFKGGLAGDSEIEIRYHTATHLLNAALRKFLGDHVYQKGSNINVERMRFDFSHEDKIENDILKKIEDQVNDWIQQGITVERLEMNYDEAKKMGAIGVFDDKYENIVSVYKIGDVSMELCGGPHVKNTIEIGNFKIIKEESSSKGVRRIKAILESSSKI
jgi:alanyl-tRNA synthetase